MNIIWLVFNLLIAMWCAYHAGRHMEEGSYPHMMVNLVCVIANLIAMAYMMSKGTT